MTARLPQQWAVPVGDQILAQLQNPNLATLTRSTERGIITNLGNQVQVWKRILDVLQVRVPAQSEAAAMYGWKQQTAASSSSTAAANMLIPSSHCAVFIGLAPFTPRCILEQIIATWMEDLGFGHVGFFVSSVAAARPSALVQACPIACVVDLGWSATWVVTVYEQRRILAVRRVPLGGRHLLQLYKYWITYRQWNLMDQEFVMRHVLESTAQVSLDFEQDMRTALRTPLGRRLWDRHYVLPDYDSTKEGVVQIPEAVQREMERRARGDHNQEEDDDDSADDEDYDEEEAMDDENDQEDEEALVNTNAAEPMEVSDDDEDEDVLRRRLLEQRREEELRKKQLAESQQILRVSTERFAIPEVLFRPQDAGLPPEWAGVPEAIVQAIEASPQLFRPALYQSIQLVGGVSQLPNLAERLTKEVRSIAPDMYELSINKSDEPILGAWRGARELATKITHKDWSVGQDEWKRDRLAYNRLLAKNGGFYI